MISITYAEFEKLYGLCDITYIRRVSIDHSWLYCVLSFSNMGCSVVSFIPYGRKNRHNRFDADNFTYKFDAVGSTVVITDKRKKGHVWDITFVTGTYTPLNQQSVSILLGRDLGA